MSNPVSLVETFVGKENIPIIDDWLTKRPLSARGHDSSMTLLNDALLNSAISFSNQLTHIRPETDNWAFRVFPRQSINTLVYELKHMQIPAHMMRPAPERSAPELVTFQLHTRSGSLQRFALSVEITMDDYRSAVGAMRFNEQVKALLYSEIYLFRVLAIRTIMSFPLNILRNDDHPTRPNYHDFPAAWRTPMETYFALADPDGIFKLDGMMDQLARSYNRDITYDTIVLPAGSKLYVSYKDDRITTFNRSGMTILDIGNQQIVFSGLIPNKVVYEDPYWTFVDQPGYDGDALARDALMAGYYLLDRTNVAKPSDVSWLDFLTVDIMDQQNGRGRWASFGPKQGLFEFNIWDENGDLDPDRIDRMFSNGGNQQTPFTWYSEASKKYLPAKNLGDVPFEFRDIMNHDALHIRDVVARMACDCDIQRVETAFREISNLQEELSHLTLNSQDARALLDLYSGQPMDQYYGINHFPADLFKDKGEEILHFVPFGWGGINGLMYMFANADRIMSHFSPDIVFRGKSANVGLFNITEKLKTHMPIVMDFIDRLINIYPDCPLFEGNMCPVYCKTVDDYMKQFYAAYVFAFERFTLYPVWSNNEIAVKDLQFEEYLTPLLRNAYRRLKETGELAKKIQDLLDGNEPGQIVQNQNIVTSKSDKIALANVIATKIWKDEKLDVSFENLTTLSNEYYSRNGRDIDKIVTSLTSDKIVTEEMPTLGIEEDSSDVTCTAFVLRVGNVVINGYRLSDTSLGYAPMYESRLRVDENDVLTDANFSSSHISRGKANPRKRKTEMYGSGIARKFKVHPILLQDLTVGVNEFVYSELLLIKDQTPPFSPQFLRRLEYYGNQENPLTRGIGKIYTCCRNSKNTLWGCINANVCPPITSFYIDQFRIRTRTQAAIWAKSKAGVAFERTDDLHLAPGVSTDGLHKVLTVHNSLWAGTDMVDPALAQVVPNVKGAGYTDGFDPRTLICENARQLDLTREENYELGSVRVIPLGNDICREDVPVCVSLFGKDVSPYEDYATFNRQAYEETYESFLNVFDAFTRMYSLHGLAPGSGRNNWDPNMLTSDHFVTSNPGLIWHFKHRDHIQQNKFYEAGVGPFKNYGPELRGVLDGTVSYGM
jgi:hypothetical protein